MNIKTPVILSDGTKVFDKLKSEYIAHAEGRFILAPSGAGKTYYVERQKEKHWIDGDYFWPLVGADMTGDEWEYDFSVVMEVNNKCDLMTQEAKKQGLWVIGASNHWLKPDAIVIPDEETHRTYIQTRETGNYDGGATTDDFEGIKNHIRFIKTWADQGVPVFKSVAEAAQHFVDSL